MNQHQHQAIATVKGLLLAERQVREQLEDAIREAWLVGVSDRAMGRILGISYTTVARRRWRAGDRHQEREAA